LDDLTQLVVQEEILNRRATPGLEESFPFRRYFETIAIRLQSKRHVRIEIFRGNVEKI